MIIAVRSYNCSGVETNKRRCCCPLPLCLRTMMVLYTHYVAFRCVVIILHVIRAEGLLMAQYVGSENGIFAFGDLMYLAKANSTEVEQTSYNFILRQYDKLHSSNYKLVRKLLHVFQSRSCWLREKLKKNLSRICVEVLCSSTVEATSNVSVDKLPENGFHSKSAGDDNRPLLGRTDRRCATNIKASFGAVMPQKTQVWRIHARSNEYVEVFVNDVLQLQDKNASIGKIKWI